jgi:hypothetical protein
MYEREQLAHNFIPTDQAEEKNSVYKGSTDFGPSLYRDTGYIKLSTRKYNIPLKITKSSIIKHYRKKTLQKNCCLNYTSVHRNKAHKGAVSYLPLCTAIYWN